MLAPPLSTVWQLEHCFWNSALPASTLAPASFGPIGGISIAAGAAAPAAAAGASSYQQRFSSIPAGQWYRDDAGAWHQK